MIPSPTMMTLTKAELADLLFEQVGLNKREAKDMVEASSKKSVTRLNGAKASSCPVSAISSCATSPSAPGATPRRARKFPSPPVVSSPFMPARS